MAPGCQRPAGRTVGDLASCASCYTTGRIRADGVVSGPFNRCQTLGCVRPAKALHAERCASCEMYRRKGQTPPAELRHRKGLNPRRLKGSPRDKAHRRQPRVERRCATCEQTFTGTLCHLYCSADCKVAGKRKSQRRIEKRKRARGTSWHSQMRKDACAGCGADVVRTNGAARRRPAECETCRRDERLTGQCCPLPWALCPTCTRWLVDRRGRGHCSAACRHLIQGRSCRLHYGNCAECGALFVGRVATQRFCTDRCAKKARRRRRKVVERMRGHRKGKGRVLPGAEVESFEKWEIFERDGWRCHICGKKVRNRNRTRSYRAHPDDPTLDHLVPVVAGGDHTRVNVALAHNRCNYVRNADGPAQLRMFG